MKGTSKHFGNLFENVFLQACNRSKVICTRLPDGCKTIGKNRIIRIRTPFDWILTYKGLAAFIDTKTTTAKSFSQSKIVDHQIKEMLRHKVHGALGGYVIWFRECENKIVFMSVEKLTSLLMIRYDDPKNALSLKPEDGVLLGTAFNFMPEKIFE